MVALRMFFLYGLNVSQAEATSSSTWQEDTGRSFILHAMQGSELPTNGGSVCMPDTVDLFSFNSFESQGDVSADAAFRDKSSELRMYSIGVIQVKFTFLLENNSYLSTIRSAFQKVCGYRSTKDEVVKEGILTNWLAE